MGYRAVPENHSVWDSIDICIGDATVQRLAVHLAERFNVKLNAISCEGLILYRGSDKQTRETRARQKVTDIYCELRGLSHMPMHRDRLVLGLTAVDKDSKLPVE